MVDHGRTSGDSGDPLFIASDYVYVRTNIVKVENTKMREDDPITYHYEFDEKRYSHEEYAKLVAEEKAASDKQILDLQLQLAESQEGIAL